MMNIELNEELVDDVERLVTEWQPGIDRWIVESEMRWALESRPEMVDATPYQWSDYLHSLVEWND